MVVAIIILMFVTGIIYGIVWETGALILGIKFVMLHFIMSGVVIAVAAKVLAEKYLRKTDKDVHSSAGTQ